MHWKMSSAKWRPFCLVFTLATCGEPRVRQLNTCQTKNAQLRTTILRLCALGSSFVLCVNGTTLRNHTFEDHLLIAWWNHEMETFSALLAFCEGNSPHKSQWRGILMFSLICARINGWVNNRKAGDLRRHRAHFDVTVMELHVYLLAPALHSSDLTLPEQVHFWLL